jgi:predicted anti-sigma-YlaC factor YlaD
MTCREVGKVLQQYLDGHIDEQTAHKIDEHLDECRRCGLESEVYREIKASLARRAPTLPETTLRRLRRFGEQLVVTGGPGSDDGDDDGNEGDERGDPGTA